MDNKTRLVTYPDSLGGDLHSLKLVLDGPIGEAAAGGVHILPPFPSSGDRGFAPLTHARIDPGFGDWNDISDIGASRSVGLDLMVNHVSRQSEWFQHFLQHGRRSMYAEMFVTVEKLWPQGAPIRADLGHLFARNSDGPLVRVLTGDGRPEMIWASFGEGGWSEQVDLDLGSKAVRGMIRDTLAGFESHGVKVVRLDAVGYAVKKAGTACFMVQPETNQLLDWLSDMARPRGIELVLDIHAAATTMADLSRRGHLTYDFALPGLVLHALYTGTSGTLARHLRTSPARQLTILDCHDGIPLQPDLDETLSEEDLRMLAREALRRGANINRLLSPGDGVEYGIGIHQLNLAYLSALDRDEDAYLAARAIQLFSPGVPEIYYVGLLGGVNDVEAARVASDGRAINRHSYTIDEIEQALKSTLVRRLLDLIRLRNTHEAFGGAFEVREQDASRLHMRWHTPSAVCALDVDVRRRTWSVTYSDQSGQEKALLDMR